MSISFTGLASGFDSASYIDAVMQQESIPMNNLKTKVSQTQAYQNVFKSINTQLLAMKDAATALRDISSFKITNATSSDTTKLSASTSDNAVAGSYQVNVTQLAQQQVDASKSFNTSDNSAFGSLPDSLTISVNGKDTTIDLSKIDKTGSADSILSAISNKINAAGIGVNAALVQTGSNSKTLTLTSAKAGEENSFSITGDSFFGFENKQSAQDAKLTVNGIDVTSSTNSVENAIPGVTMQLAGIGSSTVQVSQDTDTIASKVQTFVDAYNAVIQKIQDNTQKSTTNSDGTLSLTLQGDSTLRDLQTQMNDMLNNLVGDQDGFKLLSDIGIEVDPGVTSATLMTGKITFDKDTFKEKLAENPDAVQKMFTANPDSPTSTTGSYQYNGVGFGKKFEDFLKSWTDSVNGVITSKVKGYDDDISFMNDEINSMQDRLDMKEASLKQQFANLEVVMSSLNNQKDWISSQISSLSGSNSK